MDDPIVLKLTVSGVSRSMVGTNSNISAATTGLDTLTKSAFLSFQVAHKDEQWYPIGTELWMTLGTEEPSWAAYNAGQQVGMALGEQRALMDVAVFAQRLIGASDHLALDAAIVNLKDALARLRDFREAAHGEAERVSPR